MTAGAPPARPPARSLSIISAIGSFGLAIWLGVSWVQSESQLALAQAADSVLDVVMALVLLGALRVAAEPPDEDHPLGHQHAEPIAALIAAVLAGVLSMKVVGSAFGAVMRDAAPTLTWALVASFVVKTLFKAAMSYEARKRRRKWSSPALHAIEVDARNDAVIGALGLAGFLAARLGHPEWDAFLALPIGVYIGYSGLNLARENIRLIMGASVSSERREQLRSALLSIPGVDDIGTLTAHHHGTQVVVWVDIVVDERLTLREAHDIAARVESVMRAEPDVAHCAVHVDIAATA